MDGGVWTKPEVRDEVVLSRTYIAAGWMHTGGPAANGTVPWAGATGAFPTGRAPWTGLLGFFAIRMTPCEGMGPGTLARQLTVSAGALARGGREAVWAKAKGLGATV